jgi:hypothetical protein
MASGAGLSIPPPAQRRQFWWFAAVPLCTASAAGHGGITTWFSLKPNPLTPISLRPAFHPGLLFNQANTHMKKLSKRAIASGQIERFEQPSAGELTKLPENGEIDEFPNEPRFAQLPAESERYNTTSIADSRAARGGANFSLLPTEPTVSGSVSTSAGPSVSTSTAGFRLRSHRQSRCPRPTPKSMNFQTNLDSRNPL